VHAQIDFGIYSERREVMGADGGFLFVKVTSKKIYESFWFYHPILNPSCKAYRNSDCDIKSHNIHDHGSDEWLYGGYGTDCDFDINDLINFVNFCSSNQVSRHIINGKDIRDLTFQELIDSAECDYSLDVWSSQNYFSGTWYSCDEMSLVFNSIKTELQTRIPSSGGFLSGTNYTIPERIREQTIRSWGTKLSKMILSPCFSKETWT